MYFCLTAHLGQNCVLKKTDKVLGSLLLTPGVWWLVCGKFQEKCGWHFCAVAFAFLVCRCYEQTLNTGGNGSFRGNKYIVKNVYHFSYESFTNGKKTCVYSRVTFISRYFYCQTTLSSMLEVSVRDSHWTER